MQPTMMIAQLVVFSILHFGTSILPSNDCTSPPWDVYQVHVLYHPNNPLSVTAKEWFQTNFCEKFDISPCEVQKKPSDELYIFEDLGFSIPHKYFTYAVPWLMQNRLGRIGGGYDLDLLIHPDANCSNFQEYNYSVHVGDSYPFNTNHLINKNIIISKKNQLNSSLLSRRNFFPFSGDNDWAYKCSEDDMPQCTSPYANNTQCSDATHSHAFHIHMYYINNNPDSVTAKNKLHDILGKQFNISTTVCPDDSGHEQDHPTTCWLTGPGGKEAEYPQDHDGSSFVVGTHSLYVLMSDFTDILSYLLKYKNIDQIGSNIDFLIHPTCGCNFADHQDWSLRAGNWDNNFYGICKSGGYTEEFPPSLDPQGINYPMPSESGCNNSPWSNYSLHVLYNPSESSSSQAKEKFLKLVKTAFAENITNGIMVILEDMPDAYIKNTPFLTGQLHFGVSGSIFDKVIPWAMQHRTSEYIGHDLDLIIAPHSGCIYHDYAIYSLRVGSRWPLNTHALFNHYVRPVNTTLNIPNISTINITDDVTKKKTSCLDAPWSSYVLYMLHAHPNAWARNSGQNFTALFAKQFGLSRKECVSQYPNPEPDYGNKLCMMSEIDMPYKTNGDPLTTTYTAVFVPAQEFHRVVSWAMEHRDAAKLGQYQVDLFIVPLSGCPLMDYTHWSLKAGHIWEINTHALQ